MSLLRSAPFGASSAPCFVCGIQTFNRLPVGDGLAPLCEDSCVRAFPRVLGAVEAARGVAYLFSSRDESMGGQALRKLRKALETFFPEDSERLDETETDAKGSERR